MTNHLGRINIRNTMSVLDAIYGNVPDDVQGFVHQRFVNERLRNESVGRALNRGEMDLLRREIDKIVQDFSRIERQMQANGLSLTQEQQKLAALIYIYNHILKTVSYANIQFLSTGQVQNQFNDLSNYPSAFSALVLRRSICCGISDAIFLLCKVLDIACEKWLTPGGGHAFNKVRLGETWYKVDATFQIVFLS